VGRQNRVIAYCHSTSQECRAGTAAKRKRKAKSRLYIGFCFTQEPWHDLVACLHSNLKAGETVHSTPNTLYTVPRQISPRQIQSGEAGQILSSLKALTSGPKFFGKKYTLTCYIIPRARAT